MYMYLNSRRTVALSDVSSRKDPNSVIAISFPLVSFLIGGWHCMLTCLLPESFLQPTASFQMEKDAPSIRCSVLSVGSFIVDVQVQSLGPKPSDTSQLFSFHQEHAIFLQPWILCKTSGIIIVCFAAVFLVQFFQRSFMPGTKLHYSRC